MLGLLHGLRLKKVLGVAVSSCSGKVEGVGKVQQVAGIMLLAMGGVLLLFLSSFLLSFSFSSPFSLLSCSLVPNVNGKWDERERGLVGCFGV
jgi:hypothetical protein